MNESDITMYELLKSTDTAWPLPSLFFLIIKKNNKGK